MLNTVHFVIPLSLRCGPYLLGYSLALEKNFFFA
jgi:hypothetical protein